MSLVPVTPTRPWVDVLGPALELAKAVANTDFVPAGIRTSVPKITAAILYGDEIGLGPMQSLARISVIDGRPSVAAETQRGLILAAGHELWLEEYESTRVTWCGKRRGSDTTGSVTWTMDDARKANLAGRPNYRTYPRQMLSARASAELARQLFADVIGGIAATEEIADEAYLGAEPDETPPPARTRRRRRAVAAVPDPPVEVVDTDATEMPPAETEEAEVVAEAAEQGRLPGADAGWPEHLRDLPPLPDEEPEPEPEDGGPLLLTGPQRRKLNALFRDVDIRERRDRLAYAARAVGRDLGSSAELTIEEASLVIDRLEAAASEQASEAAPDGE